LLTVMKFVSPLSNSDFSYLMLSASIGVNSF
jgi:hypothetical protein